MTRTGLKVIVNIKRRNSGVVEGGVSGSQKRVVSDILEKPKMIMRGVSGRSE